ncbi:PREDICTED: inactive protein RESTRICTED TEV MOVEMENT 2-like isoform X2 [Nicotiana attenuata]|uniref:inactive protein RESTRICTED TEV MOVEMENT 2-like isoform X2 n=1 Tax=Nicotiana attenuata TaxID=49451 RepID=UPI000904C133|nr:PREDICTED: inactive protein RESTRICTED TEV MOVEMENT 2-like isoform X2 [Nicotiana attenuata]XP_019242187.1 PREDICTED: inactive protein RESTRICTED TEV MOVEMENT 2-like isoform X2 [Nicotiana attenuata]
MSHLGDYRGGVNWTSSTNSIYEDLEPSSGWIEDTNNHYLLIDLPGFKREEVKLQVDIFGNITVSGERKVSEYKYIRFKISTKAPEKSKCEDTSARLEDGILYVIIPKELPENKEGDDVATDSNSHEENQQKKPEEEEGPISDDKEQSQNAKEEKSEASEEEEFHDAKMAKKWHGNNLLVAAAKETMRKNKMIIITALIAFSLGVLVSHKCQSSKID